MADKNLLRKKYKAVRREMTDKDEKDERILNTLKSYAVYKNCSTVFLYISSDIEVDTKKLISYSLSLGKTVAAPLCDIADNTMGFYAFKSFDQLCIGPYRGIPEPDKTKCKAVRADENTLCIVPGLSYDTDGYRLGFGKGYYDRFLCDFPGKTVGLCYDECISDRLIHDEFDVKISAVITDKRIISCDKENSDGR